MAGLARSSDAAQPAQARGVARERRGRVLDRRRPIARATGECRGRVAILGLLGGREIERFDVYTDLRDGASVPYVPSEHIGSSWLAVEDFHFSTIAQEIASGKMPSILDRSFPFAHLTHGHRCAESNRSAGTIAVTL